MVTRPFESKIQDIVYNVDVGIGLRLIKLGLYLLFLLSVMVLYTATQFRGLRDAEAMEYAQLGRNLMKTGSLSTQVIRPASMWYLIENSKAADPQIRVHPDILTPPVYPAILAGGFFLTKGAFSLEQIARTFPPENWVIIPMNLGFTVLTGLLIFMLARRMFDARVAILGITLFFLSDATWDMAISGTGVSVVMFFSTAAVYCAVLAASQRQAGRPAISWLIPIALSALLCSLAFLTRYAAIVIAPCVALFLALSFRERRGLVLTVFALLFVLPAIPWLARNYVVSGGLFGLAPYMALNGTNPITDNLFDRTLAQTLKPGDVITALQTKLLTGVATLYDKGLRTIGDGFAVAFFLTTFFFSFAREPVRRLRWGLALSLALMIVVAALYGDVTARLLGIFWPFVLLYAVAFFYILLDRMQIRIPLLRIGVIAVFVVLSAAPLVFRLLPPRAGVPYPPYFPPYISHVCRMMTPDELLCTDMPWATAWYGSRNSLLLPSTLDEFYEINDYTKRVSGLYFTTITRDREYVRTLMSGPFRTWFPIMEGRIPADFPLTVGFPLNNFDQLFLTDRQRW